MRHRGLIGGPVAWAPNASLVLWAREKEMTDPQRLSSLSPEQIRSTELAGDKIVNVLSHAPGNGAAIGGVKVVTDNGWFAARPSGTENIYKIYGESFKGKEHLARILEEAQQVVDGALSGA